MRIRFCSIDELQFLTCIEHNLWGSKIARFSKWQTGDLLVFKSNKALAGVAEVAGPPFQSEELVWTNGLFPHRIKLNFISAFSPENRIPFSGKISETLTKAWKTKVGLGIRQQSIVEGQFAEEIYQIISACPNDLAKIRGNLPKLIDLAKIDRETNRETDQPEDSSTKSQYWLVAAGERGEKWDDFKKAAEIRIAFGLNTDLSAFEKIEEIEERLQNSDPDHNMARSASMCWDFAKTIKNDDIVIIRKGRRSLLGYGAITSEYIYDSSESEFRHVRKVKWIKTGNWDLPNDQKWFSMDTVVNLSERKAEDLIKIIEGSNTLRKKYYWLYCNPSIWDPNKMAVGTTETYTSHNKEGNKRVKYKHYQAVKPGDLLVLYESSPTQKVNSICEITKGLHVTDGVEKIEFKKMANITKVVSHGDILNNDNLKNAEHLKNTQGSLFQLSKDEFEEILNLSGVTLSETRPDFQPKPEASIDIFIEPTYFQEMAETLKHKKNIVLAGPPGVGKTIIAKELARSLQTQSIPDGIRMVQFHQSYSYEDFVQGYRPSEDGGFKLKDGVFKTFCEKAAKDDRNNKYIFIIDEINRGNLSKIFGELMMLIESDKRGKENGIPLTYSSSSESTFYVPDNVYLIGTMNTADRSLAMIDYALRRRFSFFQIKPQFNRRFRNHLSTNGVAGKLIEQIISSMEKLNTEIANDKRRLGEGFTIGHSFFCAFEKGVTPDQNWYERIVNHEIKPLLNEYFYDDEKRAKSLCDFLLGIKSSKGEAA